MAKIAQYIFRPILIVSFLIGLLFASITGWDIFVGDEECPEFVPAGPSTIAMADESLTGHLYGADAPFTRDQYWKGLQNTIDVLDEINPKVAAWVREQDRDGKIIFTDNNLELAKYDYLTRELSISHIFFVESERKKVSWICHEYRHSRQNFGKVAKYFFSYASGGQLRREIVENDACLYEKEAAAALSPPQP